jgi:predicted nucleic acid-binding protein
MEVTNNLLGLFETSDNFQQVIVHYNWRLISKDEDDNKFIDAYVSSNADFLISNDSAITNLRNNPFPALNILALQEFRELLKDMFSGL